MANKSTTIQGNDNIHEKKVEHLIKAWEGNLIELHYEQKSVLKRVSRAQVYYVTNLYRAMNRKSFARGNSDFFEGK
jgi:hypothetical protein